MDRLSIATSDSPMRMVAASKLFYIGDTMLLASKWLFLLGLSTISLAACTTTKVRTYRDPSLIATQINSIAILPFRVCPTFYTLGSSASCGPFSIKSAMSRERYFIA
jgi:hypothetical protein